jgi:SAM-dependent methyltransferase
LAVSDDRAVSAGKKALRLFRGLEELTLGTAHRLRLEAYLRSDRRPWRAGYTEFRARHIARTLADAALMATFRDAGRLPSGYGVGLDARAVEIPWSIAGLGSPAGNLLDAGSSLNHDFAVRHLADAGWKLHVLTLAPEWRSFWDQGVSYVFGDLRRTVFGDGVFDSVVSISTIEHVGMDNSFYAGDASAARPGGEWEFLEAVKELKRVLKPGATLRITFPFGRHQRHGWFQQMDAERTDRVVEAFAPARVVETIYRYRPDGWQVSDRAACADCEFFDVRKSRYFDPSSSVDFPPDRPAAERAVACLALTR